MWIGVFFVLCCVPLMCVVPVTGQTSPSLTQYCAEFESSPDSSCSNTKIWEGLLVDLFSPDDTCPKSARYIDWRDNELEVSASDTDANCNTNWGRRFDPTTSVNPVIGATVKPCERTVSFISKVPPSSPLYADAQKGALDFTLTLGSAYGKKVLKWNGVYNGQGGVVEGKVQPASACDNIWAYQDVPSMTADPAKPSGKDVYLWVGGSVFLVVVAVAFSYIYFHLFAESAACSQIGAGDVATNQIEGIRNGNRISISPVHAPPVTSEHGK